MLTSNDILLANLSVNFDYPVIHNTVKYIGQSKNNSSQCVHSFNTRRLIADWSFRNVNSEVTPYGISLNVSVPPKTQINTW